MRNEILAKQSVLGEMVFSHGTLGRVIRCLADYYLRGVG
jgi:hypothetical protein